jgi:hypothetical protein
LARGDCGLARVGTGREKRIRLESAARHARLVQEGKIDDDGYDRYCRENSSVIPGQGEEGA